MYSRYPVVAPQGGRASAETVKDTTKDLRGSRYRAIEGDITYL